jgi:hypothetical protein
MSIVNQDNWSFLLRNSSPPMHVLGTAKPRRTLSFSTAADLVRYLADEDQDDYVTIQAEIEERIKGDTVFKAWRKIRTRLKDLKHFPKYRKNRYDHYHAAARACAVGNSTQEQKALAQGLEAEIDASRIVVPAGQIVFHGRANREITTVAPYPTFISTSLNPVVARNSAFRRAGSKNQNGQPVVYVLTLRCPLPALWGQTGRSFEYELLLPSQLTSVPTNEYQGCNFDVVEAAVVRRG